MSRRSEAVEVPPGGQDDSSPAYTRNSYCSYCGHAFRPDQVWPRRCEQCRQTTFQNPTPVAITIVPVDDGVLVVQRNIEPQRGRYALPGGYIDLGESWQEAGAREVWEEAGVQIDPATIEVVTVFSAPDGTLIVCGKAAPLRGEDLPEFAANSEARDRKIITAPEALAWPLHTEALERYFAERKP